MQRLICILIGYACGLIQTGYIIGRLKGIDIRNYGSKNAGTTNVLRTMGAKYGILVFIGDALKCILAVEICRLIFMNSCKDILSLLELYGAFGTVLGHNFPFYMEFKGGKGIAATAGLIISMGSPFILVGFITFFTVYFLTNYVSLGSIILYFTTFIEIIILGEFGYFGFPENIARQSLNEFYAVFFILLVLALFRHKENIKRLFNRCERKTYIFGKPELELDKAEQQKEIESSEDDNG